MQNLPLDFGARQRPPSKRARVLHCLLRGPHTSFELERFAHDHVPSSTISELRRAGLQIHSTIVETPGFAGELARIARYTLDQSSRELAIALMTKTGRRRGNG